MPIKIIPFSQIKEIMEKNMYYTSTVKPKKRCVKKTNPSKSCIDQHNKKNTIFSKINSENKSIIVKKVIPIKK